MFNRILSVAVTAFAIAFAQSANAQGLDAFWYPAALWDEAQAGQGFGPNFAAPAFGSNPVPTRIDVVIETQGNRQVLTGVQSLQIDGKSVVFEDGTTNFDDFLLLARLVARDFQTPALNLMLQTVRVDGRALGFGDVVLASDLVDDAKGNPDDIRWAQTSDGRWIADIGVVPEARLLAVFLSPMM